ncbi:helix-turn-helix domain-containing protein [Actinocorallia longicatena]|uniref:TetR/AcrR family transcriptional regulator n=1 Tax=Actinocorallia longicatena TaxID=111803 RepID=A0ABP6QFY1_9ACTN
MRERILAAAIEVIKERGVVGATTKEIARRAGVSEGSLYNHFANKTALFGAALAEVAGGIRNAMMRLLGSIGENTVEDNLAVLAAAAVRFYGELLPMTGPALGDPKILAWLRSGGPAEAGSEAVSLGGPVAGHSALIGYLEAERELGRFAKDSAYFAAALLGACQQHAFLAKLADPAAITGHARLPAEPEDFARGLARTLLS